MAGPWKRRGDREPSKAHFVRSLTREEFEHFLRTKELPAVAAALSAIDDD